MNPASGADAPQLSLVVATTARSDRVAPLLERLRSTQEALGTSGEVVLVDNSSDGALTMTPPDDRVRIVRAGLPGLSRARTTGSMHARGEVLVYTDDDVDFDPTWPVRMANPILSGRAFATAAPIRLGAEFDSVTVPMQREWLAEANLTADQPVRLVGAGMAIHRELLGIGLWDERLGAGVQPTSFGEESLFEAMIRAAGATVEVCRDAEVVHHPDTARNEPRAWRQTAAAKGRSAAYIAYHWYGEDLRHPRLRARRRRLRLHAHRRRHDTDSFAEELRLIESIAFAEGMAIERLRPRAYVPRPLAVLPNPVPHDLVTTSTKSTTPKRSRES